MSTERFCITSTLPSRYREQLEDLLFFNPQQQTALAGILESLEMFGVPEVVSDSDLLSIIVGKRPVQALFALVDHGSERDLVGAIVYVRANIESLVVLHVAVREDFSSAGSHSSAMLVLRLCQRVRDIARRLKGVRSVSIFLPNGATWVGSVQPPQ